MILDTDIGDDIDDTWALALLLRSPELDVKLIVGDNGNSEYRAKLIAKLLEVSGRTDIPVGIGLSGKMEKGRQAKWVEDYDLASYPGTVQQDGVGALIDTILKSPEPITLIAIGPVQNLKEALQREPKIVEKARFVGMHGSVRKGYDGAAEISKEYNVVVDVPACQAVFSASWGMTITPLDTCGLIRLTGNKYAKVRDCKNPLAAALVENYRLWAADQNNAAMAEEQSSILFDTVAIYLAFAQDLVKMEELPIRVDDEGYTRIDPKGNRTRVATEWKDLGGFEDLLVERLATETAVELESAVPRWRPHDVAFQGPATALANSFTVPFSATLIGPNGTTLDSLGFYDGDNAWKVRVAPTQVGDWTLTTHSDVTELDGQTVSFQCVENTGKHSHGGLRVDPEHPRHFVYDDGTRYFPLGYECDWLWALDTADENLPTLLPFLDRLAESGFNYLILNTYANDTSWRTGKTEERDYGPPPLYAWEGSNEQPDHSRFNLAFWRHYDGVLDALCDRGITAHIMIKVYNKKVKWPKPGSAEDELFFRWLVARYAAYPNVVWDFSKEAHNEKDLEYKKSRLHLVRDLDPYDRLLTVHDDNEAYESGAYDEILDYRSDQHHKGWHKKILTQRKQREWPILNVEFGYEQGVGGPEDKTYDQVQPPEEIAKRAWEICMAGGYTAYYYTNTAWDVIHPEEVPAGYAYMRNLRTFFESGAYWLLEPMDKIVEGGYCLASPNAGEYVVYVPSKNPVSLDLTEAPSELKGKWFHPFTGEWQDAGTFSKGARTLPPPTSWGEGPFLLRLRSKE